MLSIGRIQTRECSGWTRRELLRAGMLSAVGVNLADALRAGAAEGSSKAPAKSVILLWLWGGPSHLDSFDMKPKPSDVKAKSSSETTEPPASCRASS